MTTDNFTTAGAWSRTIPAGVTSVVVDIAAPSGGAGTNSTSNGGAGGLGGRVQGTIAVTPGDVLSGTIGGAGASGASGGAAGSNGGGAGGSAPARVGGGGGGLTDLKLNGTTYVIAGGGAGGGSGGNAGGGTTLGGAGGNGGNTTGANGTDGVGGAGKGHGGHGGSTSGGAGGTGGSGADGSAGTSLTGGAGAGGATTTAGGGGGGAGFFGGGGGEQGAAVNGAGGAGGGSSFTHGSVTSVTHTQGFRTGTGYVTLTYAVVVTGSGSGISDTSGTATGIPGVTGTGSSVSPTFGIASAGDPISGTGTSTTPTFGTATGALIVSGAGSGISSTFGRAVASGNTTTAPTGVYMPQHDRTLILEISRSDALAEIQDWVNVSQYLLGAAGQVGGELTYQIGVDPNTGQFAAGTMSLYVDNTDAVFDTRNLAGPLAACLQARRQIRLRSHAGHPGTTVDDFYDDTYTDLYEGVGRAISDADVSTLFRGYVNRWPRFYGADNQFSWVQLNATDGSLILNQCSTSDAFFSLDDDLLGLLDGQGILATSDNDPDTPESHRITGELVHVVLDASEWPQGLRSIDDGLILVGPGNANGSSLSSLEEAAAAEQGEVFFWGDGTAVFYDRLWEWTKPRSVTVQATFGAGGLPFTDINGIGPDDQDIASTWRRTGLSGVEQVRQNADAKDRWGRVTDGPTSVTTVRDVDVVSQLDYLEARHGMRVEKIEELVLDAMLADPATGELLYDRLIDLRPFDCVAVNFTPPNGDPYPPYKALALQLATTIGEASWATTVRLGPAATEILFALDDSLLDSDAVTAP